MARWAGFDTASVVSVSGATAVDVALTGTYALSGMVTADGAALGGASVAVYTADTRRWIRSATSAADGSYSVAGLAAGEYKLYVQPNEPGYANRWLGGAGFDSATVVTLAGPTPVDVDLG